jgi:hypothetical protein
MIEIHYMLYLLRSRLLTLCHLLLDSVSQSLCHVEDWSLTVTFEKIIYVMML